jgi:hypothetical protein
MHNWLFSFYPDRPDLIEAMQAKAFELGGSLPMPHLPWKYSWIGSLLGKPMGRRAQVFLPHLKWSILRFYNKLLYRMARGESSPLRTI